MNSKSFFAFSIFLLFVISLCFVSCSGRSSEETKAVKAAMNSVEKNRNTIGSESQWKTGLLKGGVAILSYHDYAYWYKDGVVYVANGLAMSASPKLQRAPVGIGYSEIKAVVK